jgi:hypothetical protein
LQVSSKLTKKARPSLLKQGLVLVLAAAAVIVVSIFSTLMVREIVFKDSGGRSVDRYRGFSLEEAQKLCDRYARKTFGSRLRVMVLDAHSTRVDERDRRNKVFFVAELYEDGRRQGVPEEFFVNCHTHIDRADISNFQIAKNEAFTPPPVRKRSGNAFGF